MNNEKFMNELNKNLGKHKKEMKSKSENIIKELNDYKKMLNEELKRENKNIKNVVNDDNYDYDYDYDYENESSEEIFENLIKEDEDNGMLLDFANANDEEYEIIKTLAFNDPSFALNFIERRKSEIPEEKYKELKSELLKKMNII